MIRRSANKRSRRSAHPSVPALAVAMLLAASPAAADHGPKPCQGQDVPISRPSMKYAERASLCLLNLYRESNGLQPLVLNERLALAARRHSEDMVERDYFGHEAPAPAPYGASPQDRAAAAGYSGWVGENLALDPNPRATPHDIFNAWRSSEGHNRSMLSCCWPDGSEIPYRAAAIAFAIGAPDWVDPDSGHRFGPRGLTATELLGGATEGAVDTALDLAGGNRNSTAGCKPARRARGEAKRRWQKAKAARKRIQRKRRLAASPKAKRRLGKKLQHKRRQVTKRRLALRRATEEQKALC